MNDGQMSSLPEYDREQQRHWLELRQYTTEQLEIAGLELDETHGGYEV